MFRSYTLRPADGEGEPLVFEWDAEAGLIRGPGADYVRTLVAGVIKAGVAMGHPYPTPYVIKDPLRRAGEMAVLLGNTWHLPAELARMYPRAPDDESVPDGPVA